MRAVDVVTSAVRLHDPIDLNELQKRKDDLQPKLDKLFKEYDELLMHIN